MNQRTVQSTALDSRRNRIAVRLSNFVLRLATPEYRKMVAGAHEYGLRSAARDELQGRVAPPDWRRYARSPNQSEPEGSGPFGF